MVAREPDLPPFEALIIPSEAVERGGVEILRAAIIEGQLHVTLRRTFEHPDPVHNRPTDAELAALVSA